MKKVKIVCLANSFKEGGRCLAGIAFDVLDKQTKRPTHLWVRPVTHDAHGQIPPLEVGDIEMLDIIELEITGKENSLPHQTENYYYTAGSMKKLGKFPVSDLSKFVYTGSTLFGGKGKAVSEDKAAEIGYSLVLIHVRNFVLYEVKYEDASYPKPRGKFTYNNIEYDLPVTDPEFLFEVKRRPLKFKTPFDCYLTISLGNKFEDFYYKLIAGVLVD